MSRLLLGRECSKAAACQCHSMQAHHCVLHMAFQKSIAWGCITQYLIVHLTLYYRCFFLEMGHPNLRVELTWALKTGGHEPLHRHQSAACLFFWMRVTLVKFWAQSLHYVTCNWIFHFLLILSMLFVSHLTSSTKKYLSFINIFKQFCLVEKEKIPHFSFV